MAVAEPPRGQYRICIPFSEFPIYFYFFCDCLLVCARLCVCVCLCVCIAYALLNLLQFVFQFFKWPRIFGFSPSELLYRQPTSIDANYCAMNDIIKEANRDEGVARIPTNVCHIQGLFK